MCQTLGEITKLLACEKVSYIDTGVQKNSLSRFKWYLNPPFPPPPTTQDHMLCSPYQPICADFNNASVRRISRHRCFVMFSPDFPYLRAFLIALPCMHLNSSCSNKMACSSEGIEIKLNHPLLPLNLLVSDSKYLMSPLFSLRSYILWMTSMASRVSKNKRENFLVRGSLWTEAWKWAKAKMYYLCRNIIKHFGKHLIQFCNAIDP